MTDLLPETDYRELLLWFLGRRKRLKITGRSMLPLLKPGDEILVKPYVHRQDIPQIGEIVVTTHPYKRNLSVVKRVIAVEPNGKLFLMGDNLRESTDSRHWGTINLEDIIATATSRFL